MDGPPAPGNRAGAVVATASVLGVFALVGAIMLTSALSTPTRAASRPTPAPSTATPTTSPGPAVEPSTAVPVPTTMAPAEPVAAPTAAGPPANPGCVPRGYVWVSLNGPGDRSGVSITLAASSPGDTYKSICPGESRPVFWASYWVRSDGVRVLYASASFVLTTANNSVTTVLKRTSDCSGGSYVVAGNFSVLATAPPGMSDPYPGYDENARGGLISATGPGTNTCGQPPL